MSCGNGAPPCRGDVAPGFNPLRLCAACLARYRAISGSPVQVGEGFAEPRPEYKPVHCAQCYMGLCHLAQMSEKPTKDGGLLVTITAPPYGCHYLRGEAPPVQKAAAPTAKKRKRPASSPLLDR
jgi:hypothetical protein